MGGFFNDLAAAYAQQVGEARYGPNWVEKKKAAQLANRVGEAELANMPTPQQAGERFDATTEASRSLTGYRSAQGENIGAKIAVAEREITRKEAKDAFDRDPLNPALIRGLAQAEKALADAHLATRRADSPGDFRAAPGGGRPSITRVPTSQNGKAGTLLINNLTGEERFVPMPPTSITRGREESKVAAMNAYRHLMKLYDQMGGQPRDGLEARAGGVVRGVESAMGYAPYVQAFKTGLRGFVSMIARAVGHSGVLTEIDVQRTEELFPGPGSTAEEKLLKARLIEDIMSGRADLPWSLGQEGGKPIGYTDPTTGEYTDYSGGGGGGENLTPQGSPEDLADENRLMGGGWAGGTPPAPTDPAGAVGGQSKIINGVTYDKAPGGWQRRK